MCLGNFNITKFKTAQVHTYQPMLLSPRSKPFFKQFIEVIVPACVPNWNDNSPLFAEYITGEPVKDLGKLYKKFMSNNFQIPLTTTMTRAIHETTAMESYANGQTTLAENLSIKKVNGHSSTIAKLHYEKLTMANVANDAMRGFAVMCGTPREELQQNHVSSAVIQEHLTRWGSSHSCQDLRTERAPWDALEVDMV